MRSFAKSDEWHRHCDIDDDGCNMSRTALLFDASSERGVCQASLDCVTCEINLFVFKLLPFATAALLLSLEHTAVGKAIYPTAIAMANSSHRERIWKLKLDSKRYESASQKEISLCHFVVRCSSASLNEMMELCSSSSGGVIDSLSLDIKM